MFSLMIVDAGVEVLAHPHLGQEPGGQDQGRQSDRDDQPGGDGAEPGEPVTDEEGHAGDHQQDDRHQGDGVVGPYQRHDDRDDRPGPPSLLDQGEAPIDQPRHDHQRRELGQVGPEEPFAEGPVAQQESCCRHHDQQPALGHQAQCLPHAVRPDDHEDPDGDDQGGLQGSAQHEEDQTSDGEERPLIEEGNRRAHTERVAARPHRIEIAVAEVGRVDLYQQWIRGRLAEGPSGSSSDQAQGQCHTSQDGHQEGALVLPVNPVAPGGPSTSPVSLVRTAVLVARSYRVIGERQSMHPRRLAAQTLQQSHRSAKCGGGAARRHVGPFRDRQSRCHRSGDRSGRRSTRWGRSRREPPRRRARSTRMADSKATALHAARTSPTVKEEGQ